MCLDIPRVGRAYSLPTGTQLPCTECSVNFKVLNIKHAAHPRCVVHYNVIVYGLSCRRLMTKTLLDSHNPQLWGMLQQRFVSSLKDPQMKPTQGCRPDLCSMSFASLLTWLQGLNSLGLDNRMRRLLANTAWTNTRLAVLLQRAKAIILPASSCFCCNAYHHRQTCLAEVCILRPFTKVVQCNPV